MKISLVGHFADTLDEGVRNVAKHIARELEDNKFEVNRINISSTSSWKKIKAFQPDIVHFVMSSTVRGIIVAKIYSTSYLKAKTVISAVQPSIPSFKLLRFFKPDLTLVQSQKSSSLFNSIGFNTKFLPNGVDINKFKPVGLKTKQKMKEEMGIDPDKFVILHLASMTRIRNLDIFKKIQKEEGIQVLILGRENENADKNVISELQETGCKVLIEHFPDIEHIYNLSDCYLFPTINKKACIETPLSVLEAMACNLPVITTKFGALPNLFENTHGLYFWENNDDVFDQIKEIKNNHIEIRTREKVLPYSWEKIGQELEAIYTELL